MTIMQFVLLAFALLAAALVGYLIPVLIQLKKTLSSVDRLVEESEKELLPLLRDLGETAAHVRHIATQADEAVKNLGSATSSIRGAAEKIGLLGQVLEYLGGFPEHSDGEPSVRFGQRLGHGDQHHGELRLPPRRIVPRQ